MPTLRVNGAHLHYEEHGPGPNPHSQTIVFAHGRPWSGGTFDAQVAGLTTPWPGERVARYRCILFDFRGEGRSGGTAEDDLDTLTGDTAALMEALGATRCHFAGLSLGARVGMRLAVRRPDLLWSLVLMDPGATPRAPRGAAGRGRLDDDLARIAVPTLVMAGARDAAPAAAGAECIARRAPNARLVVVPGAARTACAEEPGFVNRTLWNFLQTNWIARHLSRAAWTGVERVREIALASTPEGGFPPVAAEVPIEGQSYSGVTFRLEVSADPARGEWPLRVTATLAAPATGRHASSYEAARDRAHLLEQVDQGRLATSLSWFLEREARAVANPNPYPPAMIAAGTHAALPCGPDCERFSPGALPGEIGRGETLLVSSHHDVRLLHCEHCGQVFLYVFVEVWDDSWGFAARVSEEEAALVRRDRAWATPLIESRRHVVWPPHWKGAAYWATGHEQVLHMGPRG